MDYCVLTLFPELIEAGMRTSILGRAMEKGLLTLTTVNIRDFAPDRYGHVDDYPYGGGAGMILQAQPIYDAYLSVRDRLPGTPRVIYVTPQGSVFDQKMAAELASEECLVFLCGHYEGVDERVLDAIVTDRISIGDYVLTGGELPALVMMDAISRMVPGVLTNEASGGEESFVNGLLEYPQYTRPEAFRGRRVPEVLLSGHHANVVRWRRQQSLARTLHVRPDLLQRARLSTEDELFLQQLREADADKNGDNPTERTENTE